MTEKIFKTILRLLAVTLLLGLLATAEEKTVYSQWISSSIKIDGSQSDWHELHKSSEDRLKVDYSFMNDENNLYIILFFKDPAFLSSITVTGLKIWLNTDGKRTKGYNIEFKDKQISSEQMIKSMERNSGVLSDEQKEKIRQKSNYISYQGEFCDRKNKAIDVTPLDDQFKQAIFRKGKDQKIVCYELRIPLKVKEIWNGQEPDFDRTLAVGFEWGGMTKEMISEMMKRRAERASEASERATEFRIERDETDLAPVVGNRYIAVQKGAQKYAFWVNVKLAKNR